MLSSFANVNLILELMRLIRMKKTLFFVGALLSMLLSGAPDVRAQAYGAFYGPYAAAQYQEYLQHQHYVQWQQYLEYLRQTDPYYDLHVMHYQLYRPPYPAYQTYVPCCYAVGIPVWSRPVGRASDATGGRPPRAVKRR